ncbi:MAG: HU family DNA-binding protein [Gemmatimonadota bacterium]|nr:HU family DNA-binding protein [Gemmatimonadota bacterium]MDE2986326.1 HU family DNA-binding protein [Gemmatimonadota bacterium]
MNKSEMARKLAASANTTQARSADLLDKIFDPAHGLIAGELAAGGKVSIGGFGTFEARERAARTGRNPRTGEAITIAAKKYPAFKAAKGLKDTVS